MGVAVIDIRVLITTSTFPIRPDDGLPRFVFDLARELARRCEVWVLAPDAPGAARRDIWDGVSIERFSYFWPRDRQELAYGMGMRENFRRRWLARAQAVPYLYAQTRAIRRLVQKNAIQVVNPHWMIPQGLCSALALGTSSRLVNVLSVHAGDVYLLEKMPGGNQLARFILSRTDAVFAAGSHVAESLDHLLGFPSNAIRQSMGVDSFKFSSLKEIQPVSTPYKDGFLLFVGRLVEKKGVIYLFRALPKILKHYPGLGLVVIGKGPRERILRDEVKKLGLENAVQFLGQKGHKEVVLHLHACRAVVVPSIIDSRGETEGMPTVLVEALAAGKKVVASDIDGIPDLLVHGRNGWMCKQKNPEDLAHKVIIALDKQDDSEIRKEALQTASRFQWSAVADSYLSVFERLLAERKRAF